LVYITGRIKEQYKLENGKYVVPTPLEEALKLSPYIANVMVYGDNRPYNVALIVAKLALLGLPGGPWGADYLIGGVLGFFIGQLMWQHREILARVPTIVLVLTLAIGATINVGSYSPLLPLDLLAWPSALLLVLRIGTFEARPLLWLGDRSYGIYLVHYPVLNLFFAALGKSHASWTGVIALYVTFSIVVLALANVALHLVERPGRKAVRAAWTKRYPVAPHGGLVAPTDR